MSSVSETIRSMLGANEGSSDFKKYAPMFDALPSFEQVKDVVLLDDGKGRTIGEIFDHFKTKSINLSPVTGVAEVDLVREQEIYVRFIIQLVAELNASGKTHLLQSKLSLAKALPVIGIKELSEISEFLGDTGANINIAGVVGKRRHDFDGEHDLYGAFAGGLGNKISEFEYKVVMKKLADRSLSVDNRKVLTEKMLWADNVLFDSRGNPVQYVSYVGAKEVDRRKVEVMTVARETLEELGELLIGDYIDNIRKTGKKFEVVMNEAFGGKLDKEAMAIFKKMGEVIDRNVDAKTYNVKCYKDEVEPMFREFLKLTPDGHKFVYQFNNTLKGEVVVTDKSFPNRAIFAAGAAIAAKGTEATNEELDKYFSTTAIAVPRSVCYVVSKEALSSSENAMMNSLTKAALNASERLFGLEDSQEMREKKVSSDGKKVKDAAREKASLFEAKGVRKVTFEVLLKNFARFHLKDKVDRFFYPHEALAAIQAFIGSEIKTFEQACAAEDVLQKELKENKNFKTALDEVAKFNVRSHREATVCKDGSEVLRELFTSPLNAQKNSLRFEQLYSDAAVLPSEHEKPAMVRSVSLATKHEATKNKSSPKPKSGDKLDSSATIYNFKK